MAALVKSDLLSLYTVPLALGTQALPAENPKTAQEILTKVAVGEKYAFQVILSQSLYLLVTNT